MTSAQLPKSGTYTLSDLPGETTYHFRLRIVASPSGKTGTSADAAFRTGARAGLALARMLQPDLVILKSRSPSCGAGEIYDGSFSHVRIPGDGVFAGLLKEEGFRVIADEDAPRVLSEMKLPAAESAGGKACHD